MMDLPGKRQSPEVRAKAMRGVQAIQDRYHLLSKKNSWTGFDTSTMTDIKLIDASFTPGENPVATCTFEMLVDVKYSNLNGVMHGGAAGVIFDMCTTSALGPLAKPNFWDFMGGVSRTINISYVRAIPINTRVLIHSEVVQAGRKTAMMRGSMLSADGKKVFCTAEHHKIWVQTLDSHKGEELEGEWGREMRAEEEERIRREAEIKKAKL